MNPIGNTGFMSSPPQGYTDYFNSLKNMPQKEDVNNNSTLPLDPKKLQQLKALNDYKQMTEEKKKILPISHYTKLQADKAHQGVNEEQHYSASIKPSKTPVRDIHKQKHISPKEHIEAPKRDLTGIHSMDFQNRMRLEQGLAPLPIEHYYPVQTKVSMKFSKPKPKPKTDSKGFPTGNLPSIESASKNPTPNIKAGDRGSIRNPIYSTDKQTSKPKPKAKPMYKTDAMGFPILGSEYDIGNVSSSSSF